MEQLPRYKHDCDEENGCHFVGQIGDDDIWFHDYDIRIGGVDSIDTCVIMRHSSEESDYGTWSTTQGGYPGAPPEYWQKAIALVVQYKHDNGG